MTIWGFVDEPSPLSCRPVKICQGLMDPQPPYTPGVHLINEEDMPPRTRELIAQVRHMSAEELGELARRLPDGGPRRLVERLARNAAIAGDEWERSNPDD